MALTLYYAPGACSFAPHIALEEAGAAFKAQRLNLNEREQHSPAYLRINPRARVPALVLEDGNVITENIAILTYIAHRFPDARLLPASAETLARAYEIMSWFASTVHVSIAQIWRTARFTDTAAAHRALQLSGQANFVRCLAELDAIAEHPGDWLAGDAFSVVDAYGLVIWRWAERLEIDLPSYPAFAAKAQRALTRPSVQRAAAREAAAVQPADRLEQV